MPGPSDQVQRRFKNINIIGRHERSLRPRLVKEISLSLLLALLFVTLSEFFCQPTAHNLFHSHDNFSNGVAAIAALPDPRRLQKTCWSCGNSTLSLARIEPRATPSGGLSIRCQGPALVYSSLSELKRVPGGRRFCNTGRNAIDSRYMWRFRTRS